MREDKGLTVPWTYPNTDCTEVQKYNTRSRDQWTTDSCKTVAISICSAVQSVLMLMLHYPECTSPRISTSCDPPLWNGPSTLDPATYFVSRPLSLPSRQRINTPFVLCRHLTEMSCLQDQSRFIVAHFFFKGFNHLCYSRALWLFHNLQLGFWSNWLWSLYSRLCWEILPEVLIAY